MLNIWEVINSTTIIKNLFYSVVALISTAIILKINKALFKKLKDLNPDDNSFEDLIPFLQNIAKLVLMGGLVFALLKIWGIDVAPLVGAAGVAGIAIAFAAQDSVGNLFGGISIFFDKPFRIGDQILVQGSERGHVYKIGARSTKIRTLDNVLVTIPNSVMVTNPIFNETGYDPKMRVKIPLGVAYGSDLKHVERVLLKVLSAHEDTLEYPEPIIRYTAFGESSIDLIAIATIPNPNILGQVTHDLIKDIYSALNEENIEIPYPQRDIHVYNNNASL
jgi:small-conductance mechanosensitive channel